MIELTPDETRQLMRVLDRPGNHEILKTLWRALSCIGFNEESDNGLVIMPAPEGSNFKLAEFAP